MKVSVSCCLALGLSLAFAISVPARAADLADKTLVAWVRPDNVSRQGGSCLTLETAGDVFDAIVFGEIQTNVWMAGSDHFNRTRRQQCDDFRETCKSVVQMAIAYKGREITIYRNGRQLVRYTAANAPATFGDETIALFGKRHQGASNGATFAGSVIDARVYEGALTAEDIQSLRPGVRGTAEPWAWWDFAGTGTYERMGRFKVAELVGRARIENGALTLGGEGDALVAIQKTGSSARKSALQKINANELMLVEREKMMRDPARPKYHFVIDGLGEPGDSNGAFYHDGKYHLMFLYKREDGYRWGHSVSSDALHWRQVGDAIGPEDSQPGGCFSGGGFIDDDGTAYLSYWMLWGAKGLGVAKSVDADCTVFKTLDENPVITSTSWGWTRNVLPDGSEQVYASADPSNIWKKDGKYYMLAGNLCLLNDLGRKPDSPEKYRGDCAYLFESADLRAWKYVGPFYQRRVAESRASGWTDADEDCMCPSFLPLPRSSAGGTASDKHLLLFISHNRGCQYYIGSYGANGLFVPETHGRMTWNDKSYFAPEALVDGRGRQIVWTWLLDNMQGAYERNGWSGVYGLPRSVWLAADGSLGIAPIEELATLRMRPRSWADLRLSAGSERVLDGFAGDCCELEVVVPRDQVANLRIEVRGSADWAQHAAITVDPKAETLNFIGDKSSSLPVNDFCCHVPTENAPFRLAENESLKLRVFVDASVIEVFANDRQAITRRVYPDAASKGVRIKAVGGDLSASVKAWEIMPTNAF